MKDGDGNIMSSEYVVQSTEMTNYDWINMWRLDIPNWTNKDKYLFKFKFIKTRLLNEKKSEAVKKELDMNK